jgi:MYXO-CTERM domain-containing protein
MAGAATSCDDHDPCTTDQCADPGGCTHTHIAGCGVDASVPDSGQPDAARVDARTDVVTTDVTSRDVAVADTTTTDAPTTSTDSAVSDGGNGGDSGGPAMHNSCACSVPAQRGGSARAWSAMLLLAAAYLARRRRRGTGAEPGR